MSDKLTTSNDVNAASRPAPESQQTQVFTSSSSPLPPATSAVSRGIDDLHIPTWLGLIAGSAFCRTALQHPLNVAVSRKRISDGESPSLRRIFGDAFRGIDGDGHTNRSSIGGESGSCSSKSSSSSSSNGDVSNRLNQQQQQKYQPVKGVRNLYRGFGTAAVGNMIGEMLYLVTVETVRHRLGGGSGSGGGGAGEEALVTINNGSVATEGADINNHHHHHLAVPHPHIMPLTAAEGFSPIPTCSLAASGHSESAAISSSSSFSLSSSSSSSSSVLSQVGVDAAAGMIGDVTSILVCTPLAVAINRQMTAGYGLNRDAPYRTLCETLRDMWKAHERNVPTAAAGNGSPPAGERRWGAVMSKFSSNSYATTHQQRGGVGLAGGNNRFGTLLRRYYSTKSEAGAGLKGWYAGLSASLFMLPASGVWWASYGQLKKGMYTATGPYLDAAAERRRNRLMREPVTVITVSGSSGDRVTVVDFSKGISNGNNVSDEYSTRFGSVDPTLPATSTSTSTSAENYCDTANINITTPWYLSSTDNPLLNGFAGVLATLVTTVVYNPVSVLRTRLQALPPPTTASISASTSSMAGATLSSSANGAAATAATRMPSVRKAINQSRMVLLAKELVAREGYRGFFKGTLTNASVSVVDGLLFATLYELTKLGSDNTQLQGG